MFEKMRVWLLLLVFRCIWSYPRSDVYPKSVQKYEIRRDELTGDPVSSGHIHTLEKSSLKQFRAHLQCSKKEPNLNFNSGAISMMRLVPPTSVAYESYCASVEMHCLNSDSCERDTVLQYVEKFKKGSYVKNQHFELLNIYSHVRLVRIVNGTVLIDWPWGMDSVEEYFPGGSGLHLLALTMNKLNGMSDSTFFFGADDPGFPYHYPVSAFTFSNSNNFSDMVFPWYEMWALETKRYKAIRKREMSFTEENYKLIEPGYKEWEDKLPVAAFFASIWPSRLFLFDQARRHPDLIDAGFPDMPWCPGVWNPASTEPCNVIEWSNVSTAEVNASQSLPAGYLTPLLKLKRNVRYAPASYKYVIVPLGNAPKVGLSTSGRLSHLLAYSGAVVLMPRSSYKYHFSAQLVPWVHYVPLSLTGADVAEKVQWLRDHDDLARQIAENGRNFARSYLRLEDYYCYAASALEAMGVVSGMSDVSQMQWNATVAKIMPVFSDTSVLQWPE